MGLSNLIQITAVSAILVGPLSIVGSFLTEEIEKKYPSLQWVFFTNNLFILLAFLGIYLFQVDDGGVWNLLGFLVAVLAAMFSNYPNKILGMEGWEFGGLLIALATVLFAVAINASAAFPLWVPGLWIAGIVLGIPSMFFKSYQRAGFILGALGFGLGMMAAGNLMFIN